MAEIASLLIGVLIALTVIAIRLKASKKPTGAKKIVLPPIFMSTGFLMFISPQTWISWPEAAGAFVAGVLLSWFLIKTSTFERRGSQIYLKRSRAFAFILIGLLVIRTVIKMILEQSINLPQTASIFFILAFGMILPWRIAMYAMYRRLLREQQAETRV
ncbi:cytochrome c biogenesis protein CcdC [Sporolactobacillus sp. THM7-4]|nr:cytochrome c biogenesis protein CcdC [Sporolactobacillus sp. THM7-4]